MLGKAADHTPASAAVEPRTLCCCCFIFRMKRANSLNVLNVGGREKQDSVQVRRLLHQRLLALNWWNRPHWLPPLLCLSGSSAKPFGRHPRPKLQHAEPDQTRFAGREQLTHPDKTPRRLFLHQLLLFNREPDQRYDNRPGK